MPFGSMVENHAIAAQDQSRLHQCGKKYSPGICLGYALRADFWSQTLRSWKFWARQKSMLEGFNAKEVVTPENEVVFLFPIANGTVKLSGGDQVLRHVHHTFLRVRSGYPKIHLDTGSTRK